MIKNYLAQYYIAHPVVTKLIYCHLIQYVEIIVQPPFQNPRSATVLNNLDLLAFYFGQMDSWQENGSWIIGPELLQPDEVYV